MEDHERQDPRITEQLVQALSRVEPLRARYHVIATHGAAPGSAMAVDLAHPLGDHVWTQATQGWAVGSDHALAWAELLTKAHAHPMHAHASLLRGGLEGAVTCRYLVDPSLDHAMRLRRAANLQLADLQERAKWERSTRIDKRTFTPPAKRASARVTDLAAEMKQAGVVREDPWGMTTRFRHYSKGEWLFQMLSALAHGRSWSLLASELSKASVPLPPGPPGGLVRARDDLSVLGTVAMVNALHRALAELETYQAG